MDIRTGHIYTEAQIDAIEAQLDDMSQEAPGQFYELLGRYLRKMELPPTDKQLGRKPPRVGRNEPCPCGSGKKFKRCCFLKKPEVARSPCHACGGTGIVWRPEK